MIPSSLASRIGARYVSRRPTIKAAGLLLVIGAAIVLSLAGKEPVAAEKTTAPAETAILAQGYGWQRDEAPFLRILAKDSGYRLREDEDLRRMPPPFPTARDELIGEVFRRDIFEISHRLPDPRTPAALAFGWSGEGLHYKSGMFPFPPKNGVALSMILEQVLGIRRNQVEGDDNLIDKSVIAGDWIVRQGASPEQTIQQLATILKDQLDLPIGLEFAEVERPVYVISGTYRYTPYDVPEKDQPAAFAHHHLTHDMIKIFGAEIFVRHNEGSYEGSYDEFVEALAEWIRMPIVSEVKQPPSRPLLWTPYEHTTEPDARADHDPEAVLATIAAQTGLHFDKQSRKVKILFVRRAAGEGK